MRSCSVVTVTALVVLTSVHLYAQIERGNASRTRFAFREGSVAAGLGAFTLVSGTQEKKYIIEAMGGGVCLLDYDQDGFLDIYFVNGGKVESFRAGTPSGLRNALFRNRGDRTFEDVTETAGVPGNGSWGYGCSVADFDNDGWPDIYVTNYGANILYRNLGNGRFQDVTTAAGANDVRWSTGSAWADYDNDGWLDLFVANYISLDPANLPEPGSTEFGSMAGTSGCLYNGRPIMCGPMGLPGAGDSLFRSNGDGTFVPVGEKVGLADPDEYYGLGAVWCDFDNDTRPDLYVANDGKPNYLYRNLGDGAFEEMGFLSGVAVSGQGTEQAGMGVACGDFENSGLQAIYVTNFAGDTNSLYRNEEKMNFLDVTFSAGLGPPTLPHVGWGTFFFDADNDGWLDLFVANGHVYPSVDDSPGRTRYREPNLLFRNLGGERFEEVADPFQGVEPAVSRGAVRGDLDNDGALDIIVTNLDDSPSLLWNESEPRHNFLVLTLQGTRSNRDALGARVRVRTGLQRQLREVRRGESYLGNHDPRLHFGLNDAATADEVEIQWPSGATTILNNVAANQFLTVKEPSAEQEVPRKDNCDE